MCHCLAGSKTPLVDGTPDGRLSSARFMAPIAGTGTDLSARYIFTSTSEKDTERLGQALAEALPPGTTVGLCGTLGAGKTRLVQAIAAACGVPREEVVSP